MTLKFTEDHEWIKVEGETGTIGISPYAAKSLCPHWRRSD